VSNKKQSEAPKGTPTILIIDGHEDALFCTRSLVEREGYQVLVARSAEIALSIVRKHSLYLILVDYSLPKMSVDQLVREIRKVQPFAQIILLTNSSSETPPRRLLAELDIQGYHNKADGPDKLLLWVAVGLRAHESIAQLREREQQHGRLVAHVSHELRNPINVINGYTELILDGTCGEIPKEAEVPLRSMIATTWKLNDLVANFLAYAKLGAHPTDTDQEWVSVDEIMNTLERTAAALANPDVRFTVESECQGAKIYTDRLKLLTILRNLLTNATQFTSQGSICLHVSMSGSTIRFTLRDTGVGIAAEEQDAIFEPYRKSRDSDNARSEGVGLGLALARQLTRLLGGEIRLRSEPGKGSEFTVVLRATDRMGELEDELPLRRSLKPSVPLSPSA
jgi:signal transduction histidine kinase